VRSIAPGAESSGTWRAMVLTRGASIPRAPPTARTACRAPNADVNPYANRAWVGKLARGMGQQPFETALLRAEIEKIL